MKTYKRKQGLWVVVAGVAGVAADLLSPTIKRYDDLRVQC